MVNVFLFDLAFKRQLLSKLQGVKYFFDYFETAYLISFLNLNKIKPTFLKKITG
jgi:hypothetical protein